MTKLGNVTASVVARASRAQRWECLPGLWAASMYASATSGYAMCFGFFGLRVAVSVGAVATVVVAPFGIGFLHDYHVLSASLIAYSVSTIISVAMSARNTSSFDFSLIAKRTGDFDERDDDAPAEAPAVVHPR